MNCFRRAFVLGSLLLLAGCGIIPASTVTTDTGNPPRAGDTPSALVATAEIERVRATNLPEPQLFGTGWFDHSVFASGLLSPEQAILESSDEMSVYHLDLVFSDDLARVDGSEEVLYTNTAGVSLDEVDFRLYPNLLGGTMTIDHVEVNGQSISPLLSMESSLARLSLPQPLAPGDRTVISMRFNVGLPADPDGHFGLLGYSDSVLAYDHGYPVIPIFKNGNWSAEIPPGWGDLSSTVASYYLVRITAPAGLKIAASGRQISQQVQGGRQVLVIADGPARDFYLAASSDYTVTQRDFQGVTIRVFAPAGEEDRASLALDTAQAALKIYSSRYGPYPYTELDLAATPTSALGIEYPGIVALNQALLTPQDDLKVASETAWLESTVAHEVAHQWFYNIVGNDQLAEPWLDESLAQFAVLEYFADAHGPQAAVQFEDTLYNRWSRVKEKKLPIGQPVSAFDPVSYGAIVYGRGALFVQALAATMRKEPFDSFMLDYGREERWQVASAGTFKSLAEAHCSCDLTGLFEAWIYP